MRREWRRPRPVPYPLLRPGRRPVALRNVAALPERSDPVRAANSWHQSQLTLQIPRDPGVISDLAEPGRAATGARAPRRAPRGCPEVTARELGRLRAENPSGGGSDVLERSGIPRVKEATNRAWLPPSPTRGPPTGCTALSFDFSPGCRSPGSPRGLGARRRQVSSARLRRQRQARDRAADQYRVVYSIHAGEVLVRGERTRTAPGPGLTDSLER